MSQRCCLPWKRHAVLYCSCHMRNDARRTSPWWSLISFCTCLQNDWQQQERIDFRSHFHFRNWIYHLSLQVGALYSFRVGVSSSRSSGDKGSGGSSYFLGYFSAWVQEARMKLTYSKHLTHNLSYSRPLGFLTIFLRNQVQGKIRPNSENFLILPITTSRQTHEIALTFLRPDFMSSWKSHGIKKTFHDLNCQVLKKMLTAVGALAGNVYRNFDERRNDR